MAVTAAGNRPRTRSSSELGHHQVTFVLVRSIRKQQRGPHRSRTTDRRRQLLRWKQRNEERRASVISLLCMAGFLASNRATVCVLLLLLSEAASGFRVTESDKDKCVDHHFVRRNTIHDSMKLRRRHTKLQQQQHLRKSPTKYVL